jgi:AraC-like DNA-binding protein/mannose-6-phosphate isomerase-like protein (cupin superfamily)
VQTSRHSLSRTRQVAAQPRNLPHERVDRPLVGFARDYPDGDTVPRHTHDRAQLLYATQGVMRIATDAAAFVVPPGHALWMPQGEPHRVGIEGAVAMRALFLRADAAAAGPGATTVLAVSPLLRELILAACAEPMEWDEAGRGGHLAALILDEIARAPGLPFGVPEPRADLASPRRLEDWATEAGASPRTLERLFLAETGMGFARWRQRLRLAEAAARLARGETPARAAAAVGYASAPAFGAAFRAAFGITPGGAR